MFTERSAQIRAIARVSNQETTPGKDQLRFMWKLHDAFLGKLV